MIRYVQIISSRSPSLFQLFLIACVILVLSYPASVGSALAANGIADGETVWSRIGIGPHGRAWQTVRDAWPKVRADIDAGHASTLGLIKVKSSDPRQLKQHHQVLAYGYDLKDGIAKLRLYDPNQPGRDDVTLSLSVADPSRPTAITVSPPAGPVYAFFRVTYAAASPPSSTTRPL